MTHRVIVLLLLGVLGLSLPNSLAAQANGGGSISAKIKSAIIEMAQEMIRIYGQVKTTADANNARPKIRGAMDKVAAVFGEIGSNVENMMAEDIEELENLEGIMQDPAVVEWGRKVTTAENELKEKHPEAAARLAEIVEKESQKLISVMMAVGDKIQQQTHRGGSVEK